MSTIKRIRRAVHERRVEFSDHALEEMDNDELTVSQVRTVLLHGALFARKSDDPRGVRYVVRGAVNDDDVDVVCRFLDTEMLWIITVYAVKEADDE
jgi:hypothetical protein